MMMPTMPFSVRPTYCALAAVLVLAACGGGSQAFTPSPVPTPAPTPAPTPTPPEPSPEATPSTSCRPVPPPISRLKIKVHLANKDFITLDSTPLVGPAPNYCRAIGFTDGRSFCPVRPEGDPMRAECEAFAVGRAEDTGRVGPTWTREDGKYCTTFDETFCSNHPDNQYQLFVQCGGIEYVACTANGTCDRLMTDKDQYLEKCADAPGSTFESVIGGR
jgi:hypothetical protein